MGGLLSYFRIMICSLEFIIDFCFCTEVSRIITFKVVKKKKKKRLTAISLCLYEKNISFVLFSLSYTKVTEKEGSKDCVKLK